MSAIDNILVLMDTISIFQNHSEDTLNGGDFEGYMEKLTGIEVFLPESIEAIKNSMPKKQVQVSGQCKITCDDSDTYTMACSIYRELKSEGKEGEESERCMVLNFANPYNPGGGVRRGANAQEENLCRRSSLLLSLESEAAKDYYMFNKEHSYRDVFGNDYGTNSMMLTPYVEVIKDKKYERNNEYAEVAVLTSALPIVRAGICLADTYQNLVYERIYSVLLCAAYHGYTHLVLGAWGCGAFGNEPKVIAKLFRDVIDSFCYNDKNVNQLFERISFAVPYNERRPANHLAFKEQFGNK